MLIYVRVCMDLLRRVIYSGPHAANKKDAPQTKKIRCKQKTNAANKKRTLQTKKKEPLQTKTQTASTKRGAAALKGTL